MSFGFGKSKKPWKCGKKHGRGSPPVNCICPSCKKIMPHCRGVPCFQTKCPECGSPMTRQFSPEEENEKT